LVIKGVVTPVEATETDTFPLKVALSPLLKFVEVDPFSQKRSVVTPEFQVAPLAPFQTRLLGMLETTEVPIIPKSGVVTPVLEETMRPLPVDEAPPYPTKRKYPTVVGSKTMGEAAIEALRAVVISVVAVDDGGIVTSKGPKFLSGVVNAASVFTELYRRCQYLGPEALT